MLWRRILGAAFDDLPPTLQALHSGQDDVCWSGEAQVTRGRGMPAAIIAFVMGLPPSSDCTPVTVHFSTEGTREHWVRTFGDTQFSSVLEPGQGRDAHLITERFGMLSVSLALVFENNRLFFVPHRCRIAGLPLPNFLLPNGTSFEEERDGVFHFDVEFKAPFVGLVTGYRGWLKPDSM